jgi:hypothetical protein
MRAERGCCPIWRVFPRESQAISQATPAVCEASKGSDKGVGMLANRLMVGFVLAGAACAQTGSSAFSTTGRVSAPEVQPTSPAMNSTGGDGFKGLPNLLPQPKGKATLMGGTVFKIDHVRDQMTLDLFGGGKTRILFDARTHVYRDGAVASLGDLQNGSRVYVDTVLAGTDIFAQTIRVRTQDATGQSSGQVVSYDARSGALVLEDAISPRQLRLHVTSTTAVSREGQAASTNDLLAGSLVSVAFLSNPGGQPTASAISILAAPGNKFVFVGRVTHLDLHLGLLVVVDPRDQKNYEVSFDPNMTGVTDSLREGATVEAVTQFDGRRYMASTIKVEANPNP